MLQSKDKVLSFAETNLLKKINLSKEDIKYVDLDSDERVSRFITSDPVLIDDEIKKIKEKKLYAVNVSKVVENFCIRNELNFDNGEKDIVLYMDKIQLRNLLKASASYSYIMNISFKILHFKTATSSKLTSICPLGFSIATTTKMEKYKKLVSTILRIINKCKISINNVKHRLKIKHVAGDNYMLGYFFQTDISLKSISSNSCRLSNDSEYLRSESTNPNISLELNYTVDILHDIEESFIANIFIGLLSFAESLNEIQIITSSHGLTDEDIHKLEKNIDIYFNVRPILIHENYDIAIKEHIILHYGKVFRKIRTDFTVFSSKRFESYNKLIKNLFATSVNYRNIFYSCARRAMTLENCYNLIKSKI
uniref:ATPase_AAA_core domain-containing protein n=1 Tax=Strongyloides stercoralis TaxID=6248 RepID=A0A0K0EAC1_STRER